MAPVLDPPKTVEWMGKTVPVWSMQTINYGLLLSQDPAEVDKVVNACLEDGYFYLDLQGIDGRRMLADQQETLKLMKRFFDAPLEAKNEFGLISSHLGYVVSPLSYCQRTIELDTEFTQNDPNKILFILQL